MGRQAGGQYRPGGADLQVDVVRLDIHVRHAVAVQVRQR